MIVPAPSPAPREPKTIITVISSPYCKSLAEHFNDALAPHAGQRPHSGSRQRSARRLQHDVQRTDYVQQFLHIRDALGRQETELTESLAAIQREINELRDGSRLTSDPQAVAQIHEAAQELQTAYDHQRQLSIDVQELIPVDAAVRNPQQDSIRRSAASIRKIWPRPPTRATSKVYLRFNEPARPVISTHEDKAADVALNAAQTYCVPKVALAAGRRRSYMSSFSALARRNDERIFVGEGAVGVWLDPDDEVPNRREEEDALDLGERSSRFPS